MFHNRRRAPWDRPNKMADNRDDLEPLSKEELIILVLQLRKEKADLSPKLEKPSGCNVTEGSFEGKKAKKMSQRPFDFSRYNKRHAAFKIAYLGWDFHGFASQETVENTIEGHLFCALSKACLIENRATANYSRCGRTDKGVSAFGQVIALDVRSNLLGGDGIIQSGDADKVKKRIGKLHFIGSPRPAPLPLPRIIMLPCSLVKHSSYK